MAVKTKKGTDFLGHTSKNKLNKTSPIYPELLETSRERSSDKSYRIISRGGKISNGQGLTTPDLRKRAI